MSALSLAEGSVKCIFVNTCIFHSSGRDISIWWSGQGREAYRPCPSLSSSEHGCSAPGALASPAAHQYSNVSKLPGGPVMSEKGLDILGWTLHCELQPRFHPLSSARAGGDQIVISTSGLNPVREMLWCHTHAHTCTHTQGFTSVRLW